MTTADTLRRAATVLRQAAGQATQGPWEAVEGDTASRRGKRLDVETVNKEEGFDEIAFEVETSNAAYIALVDPAVGLALADWLDAAATDAEATERVNTNKCWCVGECHGGHTWSMQHALVDTALPVARAILREGGDA